MQDGAIVLKPVYFILVDSQPHDPMFKATFILKEIDDSKQKKPVLEKLTLSFFLASQLQTQEHKYWIFKTRERAFFRLDKYFERSPKLKLNYRMSLKDAEVTTGLVLERRKLSEVKFFFNNKELKKGGFSICSFFLLNRGNNPFLEKRNVFETSYIKEALKWRVLRPDLVEGLSAHFQGEDSATVLQGRFGHLKQQMQVRESVKYFEHLLFRDSLVDSYLDGPEQRAEIWQTVDHTFLERIDDYTAANSAFFKIDHGTIWGVFCG